MIDTDFDLLCDGVNPAEAKRLRKILADWCSGDENSFPVQLALLTKSQWRAVARMPHMPEGFSKRLAARPCQSPRPLYGAIQQRNG
jgi:hypothetical protein